MIKLYFQYVNKFVTMPEVRDCNLARDLPALIVMAGAQLTISRDDHSRTRIDLVNLI